MKAIHQVKSPVAGKLRISPFEYRLTDRAYWGWPTEPREGTTFVQFLDWSDFDKTPPIIEAVCWLDDEGFLD
jgi:hypothetical protein